MIEYIKQYAKKAVEARDNRYVIPPTQSAKEIAKELNRLDPRDFEPAVRCDLLVLRGQMSYFAKETNWSVQMYKDSLSQLVGVLDGYRGAGTFGQQRSFPYLIDPNLRRIIERDYLELVIKLFPSGAWKSAVIMAGSILEAILFDRLADPKWNAQAVASPKATDRSGRQIPMKDWRLENMIDIAVDIQLLPTDPANTIHQVLRDYRNFVHPKKEIRAAHACTEAEAMLSLGALNSICNYIENNP
jgi:hypothetical protein